VERVRELIHPYVGKDGVVGIYLVGSATRPFRDRLSDYDIEVIVEDDAYERTPDEERQVFFMRDGESSVVDYEFYLIPWSGFTAFLDSTHDLFHYPYQHAVILHDPQSRVEPIVRQLAELPEAVRAERMWVHYLEFRFGLGRGRKTRERGGETGDTLNLHLVSADALAALVKLLFLVERSWPATRHWSAEELRALGVPHALLMQAARATECHEPEAVRALVEGVTSYLDARGETFHRDMSGLQRWLFFTAEGKRAFERWGSR